MFRAIDSPRTALVRGLGSKGGRFGRPPDPNDRPQRKPSPALAGGGAQGGGNVWQTVAGFRLSRPSKNILVQGLQNLIFDFFFWGSNRVWLELAMRRRGLRECVSAPGARRAKFSHALVWPLELGFKDSHSSVWPLEWSVTHKRGIL